MTTPTVTQTINAAAATHPRHPPSCRAALPRERLRFAIIDSPGDIKIAIGNAPVSFSYVLSAPGAHTLSSLTVKRLRNSLIYRSILSKIGPSRYATKNPPLQITAEHHKITRLTRPTSPHVVGSSAPHASPARNRGAITYVITKLHAISAPAMLNVHTLCREKL